MTEGPVPLRILVVDDDEVDRAAVGRAFRTAGVDVDIHEADHAGTALAQLHAHSFDCVFLDYNLPGQDGLRLLREIRAAGVVAPVVALTGHGDEQIAAELIKAGAVDYLPKGAATPERLVHSLRHARRVHLAEQQAREARQRLEFLAEASSELASSLDYHATLTALVDLAVQTLADYCLVYLFRDGRLERAASSHRDPAMRSLVKAAETRYVPDARDPGRPLARVLRTGVAELVDEISPALLDSLTDDDELRDVFRRLTPRSAIFAPLTARGRTLGVLALVASQPGRRYTFDDVSLAEQLGQRAAIAIDNANLYEEARQAVKAREDVVAVVSHDLRNPLNVIYNGAALILELPLSPDEQRRQLHAIQRSAERMNRLIGDLLDVTRLEAGRFTVEPDVQEIAPLVGEACDSLRPLAEQKSIRLECDAPDALPRLSIDRDRILQVFGNLIGNAIKFTPEQGRVAVTADAREGEVLFSVSDTGPGIAEDDLDHLFDRFWQAAGRSGKDGAGLGLTIAKGIVEAHGGRIWAESSDGRGSTFCFTIPLQDVEAPRAIPIAAP